MLHPTLLLIVLTRFLLLTTAAVSRQHPTQGIIDLVRRRLPDQVDNFVFSLNSSAPKSSTGNRDRDLYTVSTQTNGSILVEGNSRSALAAGYLISNRNLRFYHNPLR
ncbi:hypothetical protein BDV36DRAFT_227068 [Aspergillus pseudocaelatus]|uniref:Alpha-N-acetylglucosaminidase N-terminal domain-containing protein n=1 Tax=Aspergillus pseudocaelatus TaxID=1825620 RepID=A0ABQ6WDN0_9EURO|nr:hypothetical protein BDV36DRAFT_227068 [Aspergillus pseudocaelatus]